MRFNPLKPATETAAPMKSPRKAKPRSDVKSPAVFTTTLAENETGTALQLRFPKAPPEDVLKALHDAHWRWHKYHFYWYHRNTPENRAFAERFLTGSAGGSPAATSTATSASTPATISDSDSPHASRITHHENVIPVQFALAAAPTVCPIQPADTTIPAWRARFRNRPTP